MACPDWVKSLAIAGSSRVLGFHTVKHLCTFDTHIVHSNVIFPVLLSRVRMNVNILVIAYLDITEIDGPLCSRRLRGMRHDHDSVHVPSVLLLNALVHVQELRSDLREAYLWDRSVRHGGIFGFTPPGVIHR